MDYPRGHIQERPLTFRGTRSLVRAVQTAVWSPTGVWLNANRSADKPVRVRSAVLHYLSMLQRAEAPPVTSEEQE